MTDLLPSVTIEPREPARAAVVWLHGLGADGHDFEPLVPYLGVDDLAVRFVFPHAPSIPVTLNAGMIMPAWYDILDLNQDRGSDDGGIRSSAAQTRALLDHERERGIPSDRIVLAGFSQGGAIALYEGLRHPHPLAGLLALSTYLVLDQSLSDELATANRDLSVFLAHGTHDPMVPVAGGEHARARLVELGYTVEWKTYPMQHEVSPQEISDIGVWLRSRLA